MAQQDNCSPSKANSTTKDLNNCVEEEIANTEFKKKKVEMVNELKEETQKVLSDLKEDVNKQLIENTNR
jgi:hypothetical protein